MGRTSHISSAMENKAEYCFLLIILDETVILEENKEYFVRGAVDCDDFNVETGIFVGYKDKLAIIDVVAANAVVSVDRFWIIHIYSANWRQILDVARSCNIEL